MSKSLEVVILHGTGGNPEGNWFPWLKNELNLKGLKVRVPALPTPEGQELSLWLNAFKAQVGELHKDMLLIGHSMGAGFLLHLLEQSSTPIFGSIFVSGWIGLLNNEEFDPLIKSFYQKEFNWERINENKGYCQLFHGDNDPYVPLLLGQDLAKKLNSKITIIPQGGHLNAETNYFQFPVLLDTIFSFLPK